VSASTLTLTLSSRTNSAEQALPMVDHTPIPKKRSLPPAAKTANPDAVPAETETRLRSSSTTSTSASHTTRTPRPLSNYLGGSTSTATGDPTRWATSWRSGCRICWRGGLRRGASSRVLLAVCPSLRRGVGMGGGRGRMGDGGLRIRLVGLVGSVGLGNGGLIDRWMGTRNLGFDEDTK